MKSNAERNGKGKLGIFGVPLGYGAGKSGSELGVEAIRLSKVRGAQLAVHLSELGYDVKDYGNAGIVQPVFPAGPDDNPKYVHEMIESCENISATLRDILSDEAIPVILGGDHSIAIGTFSSVSSFFRTSGEEIGLIWFDAHADINTPESSFSGNIHGMPLAVLL